MTTLLRWARFNLVGAMGMAVQLAALALFNRMWPGHYLCATAAAIEVSLIHNFVWHIHYTWKDRGGTSTPLAQFLRFHLSNGLVSLLGNLVLMRIFIDGAHVPLLISNGAAILCCSVVNYCLGDSWVFTARRWNRSG